MAFSSGTFTIDTSGTPYVTGTTISSSVVNNVNTEIATGLTTCLLKDGTQTATASIPFGSGMTSTTGGFTGVITSTDTTASTSGSTGAIKTTGGIGAVKDIVTDATFQPLGDTTAGDKAAAGYTATLGLILTGQGSTYDVTLVNDADGTVAGVPTGTTNLFLAGNLELGHATDTTLARDSAGVISVEGNVIYAAGGTDVVAADGGTGRSSHTAYAVICGGTTTTAAQQSIASVGTANQVLTSNGAGALPTFQSGTSLTQGTVQASTSGAAIDFTGIPSGTIQITIGLAAVSSNGSPNVEINVQLGDAGGFETTGYDATVGVIQATPTTTTDANGFLLTEGHDAADALNGSITLTLIDATTFTWIASGALNRTAGTDQVYVVAGLKSLSAELTQVRITFDGTDVFDGGKINIQYH